MKSYCMTIYRQMQTELMQCNQTGSCMRKMIENSFIITNLHWNQVKQKLRAYRFKKEEQEIQFFKDIKPEFTSEIEYYCLLYNSILFEPFETLPAYNFWSRESLRLQKFEKDNREFLRCFHNAHCTKSPYYFLRRHCLLKSIQEMKYYDAQGTFTNGDHLLATLLALKRYHQYVTLKLPVKS